MNTLEITVVNGLRVLAPHGIFDPYPTAVKRYRRVRVGDWTGPAWQAAQYLPVGTYNFEWVDDDS